MLEISRTVFNDTRRTYVIRENSNGTVNRWPAGLFAIRASARAEIPL